MPLLAAAAAAFDDQQEAVEEVLRSGRPVLSRETLLVIVAILTVAATVFVWAAFVRKRPKEIRSSRVIAEPGRKSGRYGSSGRRRRRKRRPNHPDNFGRNPTLAETGGLPPPRPDEPPPSPTPSQPSPSFIPPV
jgi:hypothetical protein